MNNGQMDRGNENPTQHLPWWLRKTTKNSIRLVGSGIRTRDLPNASLVRYHEATSLGCLWVLLFPHDCLFNVTVVMVTTEIKLLGVKLCTVCVLWQSLTNDSLAIKLQLVQKVLIQSHIMAVLSLYFLGSILVGSPFDSKMAWRRRGINSTKFEVTEEGIFFHSSSKASLRSCLLEICLERILLFRCSHKFSMGFMSGDCGGVSMYFGVLYKIHKRVLKAVCLGSLSCIKTKSCSIPIFSAKVWGLIFSMFIQYTVFGPSYHRKNARSRLQRHSCIPILIQHNHHVSQWVGDFAFVALYFSSSRLIFFHLNRKYWI